MPPKNLSTCLPTSKQLLVTPCHVSHMSHMSQCHESHQCLKPVSSLLHAVLLLAGWQTNPPTTSTGPWKPLVQRLKTTHGAWKPVVHNEALHLLPEISCVLCLPAMRGNSTCCCRYNADVFGRIYDVNGEAAIDDVGVD